MGTNARDIGFMSEAVSAELRALLARRKMTVRAFAQANRLPLTTLHKTLNAQRVVDVEDLYAICLPLGEEPADLIARATAEAARMSATPREALVSDGPVTLSTVDQDPELYGLAAKRGRKHTEEP